MNYSDALTKLEAFRELVEAHNKTKYSSDEAAKAQARRVYEAYGEIQEIVDMFAPKERIEVPIAGSRKPAVYSNYIEAGYLSGRSFHSHQGYTQLLSIIGRVRCLAEDPEPSRDKHSITGVVQVLNRFRECCQYLLEPPSNERAVQDIVWIMLRSHYDKLDREDMLPRFGVKKYAPDFGIPELGLLLEVKYIGEQTRLRDVQEEILADVPGYLADRSGYTGIVVFVYDAAQKLRDPRKFIEDLRSVSGIVEVLVIPGLG